MNTSQSLVYRKSINIQTDVHLSKLTRLSLKKNFSWNLIGNIVYFVLICYDYPEVYPFRYQFNPGILTEL